MTDVWAAVNELQEAAQARLANVLETRGADPQQQELRRTFLAQIRFPEAAQVVDIGCGTGVLTRLLARWPGVGAVVGADPSGSFIERARGLAKDLQNVSFREADGRELPFPDASFDVAIFDSTLSHIPGPDRAIAEAFRVLRPGGWLASFDGDYATATVALGDDDPLQCCVDAMMANSVHDRWLMRRLQAIVAGAGFEAVTLRSHGFVDAGGGAYVLSIVDRGADILGASGRLRADSVAALKAEARLRAAAGLLFGHIAYVTLIARKPPA